MKTIHRDLPENSPKMFYRHFEIDERAVDDESGTISLSFSSETPVKRYYGTEILSHKQGHVQLGRVQALLFGHNAERIVGPVSNVRVEENRGRAEARFDDTDEGRLARTRVKSKSLRGVSVGYMVEKFRKLNPDEEFEIGGGKIRGGGEGNPTYVAVRWTPIEISLTPIPADHTVGVGRDARSLEGIEVEETREDANNNNQDGGNPMDANELQGKIDAAIASRDEAHRAALKQVFGRAAALGEKGQALAFRLMTEGKTPDEITDALFKEVQQGRGTPRNAGEGAPAGEGQEKRFESVDDDAFARGLSEPSLLTLE